MIVKIRHINFILSLLFISSLFWFFPYLDYLMRQNTPFPHIPGINTATIDIPTLYFIAYGIKNRNLKMPFFLHFLTVAVFFIVIEYFHNQNIFDIPNLDYIFKISRIYLYFVVLLQIGTINGFEFLFKWIIRFGLASIVLIYGSYLGLYTGHHASYVIGEANTFVRTGEMGSQINVNILSFRAVTVLIAIFIYNDLFGFFFKRKIYLFLAIFFIALEVIIHASRGAFLALITVLIIQIYYKLNRSLLKFFLLFALFAFMTFLFYNFIFPFISSMQLFERLSEEPEEISRVVQMKASWESFSSSPFFGVGYDNTVRNYNKHLTKSNFTWTQIMASSGIFYFLLYFIYILRFFTFRIQNTFQKVPLLVFAFIVINLSTHRPLYYLAVFAIFSYCWHYRTIIAYPKNVSKEKELTVNE